MNRHVFAALAVVFGVAVHGLPQHRFETYQVSYAAGKPANDGSLGAEDAASADPIIPKSESAPTELVQQSSTVSETSQVNEFQRLWKQAAQNLVTIPHLLQWVSSLHANSLMGSIIPKTTPVEETQNAPIQPETNVIVQEPETATDIYEIDVTTEREIVEQFPAEPEQVMAEAEIPASQPEPVQEVLLIEPEVLVEEEPTVTVQEQIVEEPIVSEPVQETTIAELQPAEPDVVKEVEAVQQAPAQEVIQQEPVQEATKIDPEPVIDSTQPEPIEEITVVQPGRAEVFVENPEPIEVLIEEPQPEVIAQQEIMKEPQPEPVQKKDIWGDQFVPKTNSQFQKPAYIESKKAISKPKYRSRTRKPSVKTAKTLFTFAPEPQPSPFALDAFAFPAYSYSINHQPSPAYYRRRL